MITLETRKNFATLLDTAVFQSPSSTPNSPIALIHITSDGTHHPLTHADLNNRITATAAYLLKNGLQSGDLIIIAYPDPLQTAVSFLAALRLGLIPSILPTLTQKLDPAYYTTTMRRLLQHTQAKALLIDPAHLPMLKSVLPQTTKLLSLTIDNLQLSSNNFSDVSAPNQIAFLQHSSGTTGLQKGVALSHAALLNQIASLSTALSLREGDAVISWLPLYHDMGLIAGFLLPLAQGIPLVLISPFDWVRRPALLFEAIARWRGTLCWQPNFAYNHAAHRIRRRELAQLHEKHANQPPLATMRGFINCSEPVRAGSHDLFLEKFASLGISSEMMAASYAMAENTFAVTQTALGKRPFRHHIHAPSLAQHRIAQPAAANSLESVIHVSCGPPIAGTAVRILARDGLPLPDNQVGNIVVQSNCMLTEYYRRNDLRPFQDGWYQTGDQGYLHNGELFVIGRAKDLIINAGKNVYPQDLETIINEVEGVYPGRVVAFGVPDEKEGTELIAIIVEPKTAVLTSDQQNELKRVIRQAIAQNSLVTASYVTLVPHGWLIKTSSGKAARNANRTKWLRSS